MADAFVRIGDPERSAATELLEGYLRAGRITPDDFQRRVQLIATCRTVRDLDSVMVGFQQVASQPDLSDLGATASDPVFSTAELTYTPQSESGWYEVLDPWDKPLGQSPLTLRKARRIGWVFAVAISFCTAIPISLLFPSTVEALIVFSPILLMIVVSFWMVPNEKKAYRWVANPHGAKNNPPAPSVTEPGYPMFTNDEAPTTGAAQELVHPAIPPHPEIEVPTDHPKPWTVDGPTFPTVGETKHNLFDQDEPA